MLSMSIEQAHEIQDFFQSFPDMSRIVSALGDPKEGFSMGFAPRATSPSSIVFEYQFFKGWYKFPLCDVTVTLPAGTNLEDFMREYFEVVRRGHAPSSNEASDDVFLRNVYTALKAQIDFLREKGAVSSSIDVSIESFQQKWTAFKVGLSTELARRNQDMRLQIYNFLAQRNLTVSEGHMHMPVFLEPNRSGFLKIPAVVLNFAGIDPARPIPRIQRMAPSRGGALLIDEQGNVTDVLSPGNVSVMRHSRLMPAARPEASTQQPSQAPSLSPSVPGR